MARRIRVKDIGGYARGRVEKLVSTATLRAEGQLKERTPVDTGRLRSNWQTTIQPLEGSVFNNLPYAAPVVAGINLPPSWGGEYKTKRGAEPFLDIVAKDVQTWVNQQAVRIANES